MFSDLWSALSLCQDEASFSARLGDDHVSRDVIQNSCDATCTQLLTFTSGATTTPLVCSLTEMICSDPRGRS